MNFTITQLFQTARLITVSLSLFVLAKKEKNLDFNIEEVQRTWLVFVYVCV